MNTRFDTERSTWFSEMSKEVLRGVGEHPALAAHRYRVDLGDVDITRAILVTLIVERHLKGETSSSITKLFHPLEIFASLLPLDELDSLVRQVYRRWENGLLWNSMNVRLAGTRIWNPSVMSTSLIEYWTSQRALVVPRKRLERELVGFWSLGVEIPELIDAWLNRPPRPFADYVDNHDLFDGEDPKVFRLGLACLTSSWARKDVERWSDSLTWGHGNMVFLHQVGIQLRELRSAQPFLERATMMEDFPKNLVEPAKRVREIMAEQENRHHRILSSLTSHEVFLLTDQDEDEVFADACATVYVAQDPENTRNDPMETSVGMWGGIPWGSIVVRGEKQIEAAKKVLESRVLKIDLAIPAGSSSLLSLTLDMPPLRATRVDAEFAFSPRKAHDLFRLLLLTLRRELCVEFVELRWNAEWEREDSFPIGTHSLGLDDDLVENILPWALTRLRKLLPQGPLAEDQDLGYITSGRGPLAELLRRSTHSDPWS